MTHEQTDNRGAHHGTFQVAINRRSYRLEDPLPTARQLLELSGFLPADESVLIQVVESGTRALSNGQTVDLRLTGVETFFAFRTDRVFRFTVDGVGFEWGADGIAEGDLRELARVGADTMLVLLQHDAVDRELVAGDVVRLSERGTEHLVLRGRFVTVCFQDKEYELENRVYTTEELIEVFKVEPGYLLNLRTADCDLVTLTPGQKVHLKDGMHFYSQVPCGGSS
jgi:hypothetical protein